MEIEFVRRIKPPDRSRYFEICVTSVFSLVLTLKLGLSINSHSPGDDRMMELEAAMGNGGSPMPSQWLYLMRSTLNLDLNRSFS